jgi:hypothetical protein
MNEYHIITTAIGVVFNFFNIIKTIAKPKAENMANTMPSNLFPDNISESGLNMNSGLAIMATPNKVMIPVAICNKVNGSFNMKYASIVTKTGDENWIVDASANGIKRYAIKIHVADIVPNIERKNKSIRWPETPKKGYL